MRLSASSMVGAVSDAQAAQREYREYIERWVHEIKAPITAAGLICQNAEAGLRRRLQQELARIEAHVERALFYARAESQEKDVLICRTDLEEIVEKAILGHRTLLRQSGIRVETKDLGKTVYTDEKWAVFILGQLLQNAARYRKLPREESQENEGGYRKLPRAESQQEEADSAVICLQAESLEKQVRLTVSDNGIGIAAHELPRVFDRGFTGSNGRSRGGSTGMGLYLCKRLSSSLELGIAIRSKEGEGTEVTLTFPAREGEGGQAASPFRPGRRRGAGGVTLPVKEKPRM